MKPSPRAGALPALLWCRRHGDGAHRAGGRGRGRPQARSGRGDAVPACGRRLRSPRRPDGGRGGRRAALPCLPCPRRGVASVALPSHPSGRRRRLDCFRQPAPSARCEGLWVWATEKRETAPFHTLTFSKAFHIYFPPVLFNTVQKHLPGRTVLGSCLHFPVRLLTANDYLVPNSQPK